MWTFMVRSSDECRIAACAVRGATPVFAVLAVATLAVLVSQVGRGLGIIAFFRTF